MTIRNKKLADKIFVCGIDGLDPRFSRKMISEGKMPNLKKYIEMGSAREDLMLLGSQPTVTPPQWTTLACGCHPNVHGITAFYRMGSDLDKTMFNCDSRNCHAEPIWNVTAENGIKTCVFHWPGNSWPPTSDSENLYVVDGSAPGTVCMGMGTLEYEFMIAANENAAQVTYMPSATSDLDKACVIKPEDMPDLSIGGNTAAITKRTGEKASYVLSDKEGMGIACLDDRLSVAVSPIKEAAGWSHDVPEGAKEFVFQLSKGRIRRAGLILKNEAGVYDHVEVYKNKKESDPFAVLPLGEMVSQIYDQVVTDEGEHKDAHYCMKLLEIAPDGSDLRIYVSSAMDMHANHMFSPGSLFDELTENVGHLIPCANTGNHDPRTVTDCMLATWDLAADWQSKAIHYMIEEKGVEAIFSHFHSVDLQAHRIIRFMSKGDKEYEQKDEAMYQKFLEDIYVQCDNYLGSYFDLLDKGWTIFITSDHAQVCPAHKPPMLGDMNVNVGVMEELGYTVLKRDENGNRLRQMDWEKTRAVACRELNIYINLKGRNKHVLEDGTVIDGIVDPADQYELEEQIMTDLYGYKDKKTGKRVVALALRNKDAVLLGYGGPDCGDIVYWIAEGYNIDHADGLSTTNGECDTSLSPIFVAAGKGIKENFVIDRWIKQIDVAPTVSAMLNIRMTKDAEGAPIYQMFEEEF